MKNTLKLSLLTILAIPLFIMNVSAKEIVNENNSYQRGTFENKTYDFDGNVEDFQELQIDGTTIANGNVTTMDEDTLAIDWNYLENVNSLASGDHSLSFVFASETVNTTLSILNDPDPTATINNIFGSISTEFQTAAVETDALNYDMSIGSNPVLDELKQAIVDRLAEAGFHLEDYGYNTWLSWIFYDTGNASNYVYEVYMNEVEVDVPIQLTFSNSYLRNETDRATVQSIIDNNSFLFVRYVPLIEVLEAYRNGTTASLYSSLNERMMALIEGTNIELIYNESDFEAISSHLIYGEYYFVINGIIYGGVDPVGGYVSSIEYPGDGIDLTSYSKDYIAQQLLLKELMIDGDTLDYSHEYQEAALLRGESYIYVGYVHMLEPYNYIEGANSTVTPDDPLSVRIDGDVDDYLYAEVDNQEVNSAYITVTSGSTVLDFSPEFTDSLAEGEHTLTAYFIYGKAATTFTIVKTVAEEAATTTSSPAKAVYTSYTNTVLQTETKKEELKEVSEDKKDKTKDDKKDDEKEETSKGGGGKGFVIGIIIAILIAGIGFYLYKEGQE